MPHYSRRQWSRADLDALQGLSKQLRMYCAKIRAALAPIREAVSASLNPPSLGNLHPSLDKPRPIVLPPWASHAGACAAHAVDASAVMCVLLVTEGPHRCLLVLQKRKELASPRSAHLSPVIDPSASTLQLAQVSTARKELSQPHIYVQQYQCYMAMWDSQERPEERYL